MAVENEPHFLADRIAKSDTTEPGTLLVTKIRRLVTEQLYGVLCTQGQGQPYGSLIAFAFSDDLSRAVFATPIATRKYHLLSECDLLRIDIFRFFHVGRFQEVGQWTPPLR